MKNKNHIEILNEYFPNFPQNRIIEEEFKYRLGELKETNLNFSKLIKNNNLVENREVLHMVWYYLDLNWHITTTDKRFSESVELKVHDDLINKLNDIIKDKRNIIVKSIEIGNNEKSVKITDSMLLQRLFTDLKITNCFIEIDTCLNDIHNKVESILAGIPVDKKSEILDFLKNERKEMNKTLEELKSKLTNNPKKIESILSDIPDQKKYEILHLMEKKKSDSLKSLKREKLDYFEILKDNSPLWKYCEFVTINKNQYYIPGFIKEHLYPFHRFLTENKGLNIFHNETESRTFIVKFCSTFGLDWKLLTDQLPEDYLKTIFKRIKSKEYNYP